MFRVVFASSRFSLRDYHSRSCGSKASAKRNIRLAMDRSDLTHEVGPAIAGQPERSVDRRSQSKRSADGLMGRSEWQSNRGRSSTALANGERAFQPVGRSRRRGAVAQLSRTEAQRRSPKAMARRDRWPGAIPGYPETSFGRYDNRRSGAQQQAAPQEETR
jgi:hypothetical protein